MARTSRQPPSSDWQSLLLEAIQQRESSMAVSLAQRCVHRQGMATLHTLLDRADAAAGTQGEAKSWLLRLLKDAEEGPQAITAPQPRPPEQPQAPDAGFDPDSSRASVSPPAPATSVDPPLSRTSRSPAVEPCTASAPLPGLESPAHPSLARTTTSAALDQAFAPLEIAFPPLPSPERAQKPPPPPLSTPPPPPLRDPDLSWRPLEVTDRSAVAESRGDPLAPPAAAGSSQPGPTSDALDPLKTVRGVSQPPAMSQRVPESPPDGSAAPTIGRISSERPSHRFDDDSVGIAAPLPSFHVESQDGRTAEDSRGRSQAETPAEPSAPGSKSLQAWRAWLPGPFRSRSRS